MCGCLSSRHRANRPKKLAQQLEFSHKKHAEEAECAECHSGVEASTSATLGSFVPKGHDTCAECHEDEIDEKRCAMCHIGKPESLKIPRIDRHLNFSHAAHRERAKDGCKACHAAATTAERPGTKLVPTMAGCVKSCHDHDMAQMNCELCHRDLHRYRMKPTDRLAHENGFLARHGTLARNSARCHICHDQTYCAGCHARTAATTLSLRFPEQTSANFIHRGDFMGRHGAMSRARPWSCRKCHGASYCTGCHELQGLTLPPPESSSEPSREAHGPGFMTPTSPDFHGRLARRDINRCASCHDRGASSNCVSCHRVGASGGSPHPRRHRSATSRKECRESRLCRVCHSGGMGCSG